MFDAVLVQIRSRFRSINSMYKFLIVAVVCVLVGCNDDRVATYPVKGKVLFEDGSSPRFGDVEFFEPTLKINARGKIARDGTFVLGTYDKADGAVAGQHKVVIIQRTRNHFAAQIESEIAHDHGDLVDESYLDYRTSDLLAKVEPTENEIVLTVKKMTKRESAGAD
jgi:hypothetical protein